MLTQRESNDFCLLVFVVSLTFNMGPNIYLAGKYNVLNEIMQMEWQFPFEYGFKHDV